ELIFFLPSKDLRRFQNQDAPDADQAGQNNDEEDGDASADGVLPHQDQPARRQVVERDRKEGGAQPRADRKAHRANRQRLEHNHSGDAPVGDADRLERAELLQVFDSKYVEGLSSHYNPDDQGDGDRDAEIYGNSGVPQVVKNAVPPKLIACPRTQSGMLLD